MRLRAICGKCGAEFEARSLLNAAIQDDFRVWQGIHNTICYGVQSWNTGEDGKLHIVGRAKGENAA